MARRSFVSFVLLGLVVAASARAGKPVTPAELENYGHHLALLIASGKPEPLRGQLDEPKMIREVLADSQLPEPTRQRATEQVGQALWQTVQQAIGSDADDRVATYFLRSGRDDRGDYVLLRQWDWTTLDYLRVRLHRFGDDQLRIGDVESASIGESTVGILRRYFRLGADTAKAGDDESKQSMRQLLRIAQLAEAGDLEGVVAAYEVAGETVKADPAMSLAYLQAKVATVDDAAVVLPVLDAHFKRHPDDEAAAMVAWGVYSEARRPDDARRMIGLIDRFAGGDPWLDQLRSTVAFDSGDLPEARRLGEKSLSLINDEEAIVNLLKITMRQRDHDRSLALLTRLVKEHEDTESEDYLDGDDWDAFEQSPQHARYRALIPTTKPKE